MPHKLVKILIDDDGYKDVNPVWHLVQEEADAPRAVCTGEVFGRGVSVAEYEEKTVDRGVPCAKCLAIVKWYKSIKL